LFAYGPADATAIPKPHHLFALFKSRLGFTFLVPAYQGCPGKKRLLNSCVGVVSILQVKAPLMWTLVFLSMHVMAKTNYICALCVTNDLQIRRI